MNRSYLLLGGNLGNREENLKTAEELVKEYCGLVIKSSSIYETAAWGRTEQRAFLNRALEVETSLGARDLMSTILKIERIMGRERQEKYGPRVIDIDILLFNDKQHNDPFLKIPHPEMQNRRFVLVPLAEIAGNFQHPVLKKSISSLLDECPDRLEVKRYKT